jgi:hypothetical protein
MSLYNNNLNDLLNNKVWNDFNQKLHDDRINNIVSGSKYTNAQNIYNDPRGTLLEQDNYIQKGLRTQYDELLLRQIDQPYMVDEYGDNYIAPRDMTLFTTLNKQPINVSGYIVDNNAVKRYASAITPKGRVIRNDFDFETLQRREVQDFDYKLLRAINLKNK